MTHLHLYSLASNIKTKSKEILNVNLTNYLKTNTFSIEYNENGKPVTEGYHFSISHSGTILVHAFNQHSEIGVDIELINPERNYLKLAQRYFHKQEANFLLSLDGEEALNCFYKLWTTKEAICKAQGGRLWYYLPENYLDDINQVVDIKHQLNIMQFNQIDQYSLTIASADKPQEVKIIYG